MLRRRGAVKISVAAAFTWQELARMAGRDENTSKHASKMQQNANNDSTHQSSRNRSGSGAGQPQQSRSSCNNSMA